MMHRSRRGAARVNIVWMVVVVVAFFIAIGLAFVFSDDAATKSDIATKAVADKEAAESSLQDEREAYRKLSELVGYYDREAAAARSQPNSVQGGLEQFKSSFGSTMGPDVKDFETALQRAIPAYRAQAVKITELQGTIEQLRKENEQKNRAQTDLAQTKDKQIDELRKQLADAEQAARTRQGELEQEVASVRSTLGSTETDLTKARGDLEQQARAARDKELEYQTRLKEMSTKLSFLREPERPDGRLLAVSKNLSLGWIDLGKQNRLFAGMSFRIVDGTPGSTKVKGWAEVQNVQDDMAEVMITGRTDEFDPPVPGDVVFNPLYDPIGGRNAVLLGRFSGTYNEKELQALLDEIDVHVQPKLDKTTDYLIVGSELYNDEEGEPLEEPMQPSDMATYKEAEAMGVQIVPLKQVRDYFRKPSL